MRARPSALACVVLSAIAVSAQDQAPRDEQVPVFRIETDLVRVDMYATAKDNSLVADLRVDEVEVYEDNVRQRIDTFEFVRVSAEAPPVPVAADVRSRVFVVFVDTHTTRLQNNTQLRRSLIRFLDQLLGPTDLVGLMTPDMYASEVVLGRRDTVISDLANDDRWSRTDARRPDMQLFHWENCYPRGGGGRRAGGAPGPRTGTVGGSGGGGTIREGTEILDSGDIERRFPADNTATPPDDDGRRSSTGGSGGFGGGGFGGGSGGGSRLSDMTARSNGKATIEALSDLVIHLRTLREERKAVLFVSGGWPLANDAPSTTRGDFETDQCAKDRMALERLDFPAMLRDLTKTANRANVSFYPVNSRTTRQYPREMPAVMRQQAQRREKATQDLIQGQLRALASETDGLAEVKTLDLNAMTSRILSDTSAYYLIGYRSTNTRSDRRFRAITVKVNRPGLRVRSRPGYGGEALVPKVVIAASTAPIAPVVDPRVKSALTLVERFDSAAPYWGRSSSWSGTADSGGAFWYVGELGLGARLQPAWSAGAAAEIEVLAPDKSRVLTRSLELSASSSTFMMRVPEEGVLPPGDYSVRVRLKPASGQGLAVQDAVRVTIAEASPLGEPVLWRKGPLARLPYVETADPRFRRNERLRLEVPFPAEGAVPTVRLLDRTGKALQMSPDISERPDSSGAFRWMVIEGPIASLGTGDYAIELTLNDSSRVTAFRVIP